MKWNTNISELVLHHSWNLEEHLQSIRVNVRNSVSPSDLPSALPVQQTSDRGRMIGLTMIADNCDKVFVLVARTASVVYRRARRFLPML